jgi:tetratricopeptide (TPR) repeat protein
MTKPTRFVPALLAAIAALAVPGPAPAQTADPAAVERAPFAGSYRRGEAYARLMRAMAAVRKGEVAAAVEEIQGAVRLEPDSPELLVEAAELLQQWTGRVGEAEELARRALDLDPGNERALQFLAELAAAQALAPESDPADLERAIGLFEQLLEEEPEPDPEVLWTLTQLYLNAGDLESAVGTARKIVDQRPGDVRATQTLAQLLARSQRGSEALTVLLQFVADHPWDEEIVGWAEQLATSREGWEEVARVLETRAPYPADAGAAQRLYGLALLRLERSEDAIAALERARDAMPADRTVRKDLALAYRGVGRLADASDLLQELTEEAPEFPFLHQLLAETLAERRDVEGALAAYHRALDGLGQTEEASVHRDAIRQRIALLHLGRGELEDCRAMMERLEIGGGVLELEIHARLALAEEDWGEARDVARRLSGADRAGLAALIEGEVLVADKRWSKAAARFEEALKTLPPERRSRIAEIYRLAGRPESGLELLRSWVGAEPDNAEARFHLGVYFYEMDRLDDAETELREAFRLEPRHARALNFLGYSLAERKLRLEEALGMIERALVIDAWNGAYLDSLGWVYFQMGRFDEAREPLERAARELPNDPTVLEHLGDLYLGLGERGRALVAWDRALRFGPEDPDQLRAKLEREKANAESVEEPRALEGRLEVPERAPQR